jgi:hypothetical protein
MPSTTSRTGSTFNTKSAIARQKARTGSASAVRTIAAKSTGSGGANAHTASAAL